MKISLELVPKTNEELERDMSLVSNKFSQISIINIPDLPRFEMRSWEAIEVAKKYFNSNIPHIRAIDFEDENFENLKNILEKYAISEVLVLSGDESTERDKSINSASVKLIKKIKKEIKNIKTYAVIDQYRSGIKEEVEYLKIKKEAGADGFFTQPFFCINHIEYIANILEGVEIYWGVSPVLSEKSKAYWINKNETVFPTEFKPELEWNINLAKKIKNFAKNNKSNMYIMPIRTDLDIYLGEIFS